MLPGLIPNSILTNPIYNRWPETTMGCTCVKPCALSSLLPLPHRSTNRFGIFLRVLGWLKHGGGGERLDREKPEVFQCAHDAVERDNVFAQPAHLHWGFRWIDNVYCPCRACSTSATLPRSEQGAETLRYELSSSCVNFLARVVDFHSTCALPLPNYCPFSDSWCWYDACPFMVGFGSGISLT